MATMTMITDITRAAVTPAKVTAGDTPTMAMAMGLGGVGAIAVGGAGAVATAFGALALLITGVLDAWVELDV